MLLWLEDKVMFQVNVDVGRCMARPLTRPLWEQAFSPAAESLDVTLMPSCTDSWILTLESSIDWFLPPMREVEPLLLPVAQTGCLSVVSI